MSYTKDISLWYWVKMWKTSYDHETLFWII